MVGDAATGGGDATRVTRIELTSKSYAPCQKTRNSVRFEALVIPAVRRYRRHWFPVGASVPSMILVATTVVPWVTFTGQNILSKFKVGRTWRPIAVGVERACFALHGTTGTALSPSLEYTMKIIAKGTSAGQEDVEDSSVLEYGTCVVRAPGKQPA